MSALAEIPLIGHPRFELRQALGEGGFGVVWQAWDRQHEQMVALKVLHRRDASALRRFKTEFRALANLSHEHLVSLFELHQDESRWFFTMELVDGVSFNDWVAPAVRTLGRTPSIALTRPARPTAISRRHLRASSGSASGLEPASTRAAPVEDPQLEAARLADRARALGAAATSPDPAQIPTRHGPKTPLADPDPFFGIEAPDDDTRALWDATRPRAGFGAGPPLDVARVRAAFRQLVEALAWLHSSGHLHRDVKPSNVLVTRSGELKVLDFGLVTRFWTHDLGAPDPLIGTPVYMAPEVCAGLSASPASDWYSVGVMLYWVLTGYLPFSGPDLQTVVLAKQGLDARPPSEVVSGVPDELDRLCRRLLARNPLERPDAAELLFAFGAYDLGAESLGARPHGALPSFVGRRAEVQALAQVFSEPLLVRSGPDAGPTLALVDGLSGYGKTSLVEHFLRESEGQGCLVLRSRCFERGSVRYKALDGAVDDLARWLASLSKAELDELLPTSPFDRGALARVFPVLPRITEGAHTYGADADPQEVKRRAFMALRHLLHAIARVERVIVAIDDAQWADEDSVAALAELLRPGRGTAGEDDGAEPALGWLVAYRSDEQEASPFLRAFASALVPLVPARRRVSIHVGPLADDEARRLALDLLGPGAAPSALTPSSPRRRGTRCSSTSWRAPSAR
ncbi:MAG: serine/threonine-protein kinase [Myxococcota bacterium]